MSHPSGPSKIGGTKFGKYVVERELGLGGFGRVYCGFDADMDRRVAIKVLSCESDPDLLSRFHAEAGVTARLAHRNIVTVYEFAQQNGLPYLVMELLEGRTLYEIIGCGVPLRLLEKAEIMHQVAEGLQHAHSRGVIHRDIKPGNIMVLPDGRVKIMDFGIARLMQRDGARRTRAGDLIGTVSYMAPELFQEHEPDKKTDIFAYGIVYYELLTGNHPFLAEDTYATMKRIENDELGPLRRKLPDCPEGLAILLQHLLMKDRELRLDDMSDVLFDTEPILRELRQERAAALAKEIEPLIQMGDCEMAYARVKQVLELDPAHAEARQWRDQVRTNLNRQRAERLRHQGMEHMSAGRYKEAVTCFESVLHLDAQGSQIRALLDEAKAGVERVRRAVELVNDARENRQRRNFEQALSRAAEALELDPRNREAVSLHDSLCQQLREIRLAESLEGAGQLCAGGNFDAALAVLDGLETELRDNTRIRNLRQQISADRKAAEERRRRERIAAVAQTALRLSSEGRFDEAQALIAENLQKDPAEARLTEVANRIAYAAGVEKTRRRVQELEMKGQYAEALSELHQSGNLANHTDLQRVAERLRKELDEQKREDSLAEEFRKLQKYQAGYLSAERACAARDYATAKRILDGLLIGAPDARAERLYEVVTRQIRVLRVQEAEQGGPGERLEGERQGPAKFARESESPKRLDDTGTKSEDTDRQHSDRRKATSEAGECLGHRDQAVSQGRQRAAAAAREASLVTALSVLERLARRYPNSAEVRRDLEAARRELAYQREMEERGTGTGEGQNQKTD